MTVPPAPHRATLAFELADDQVAAAVAGALQIELQEGPQGSRATMRREGRNLHATVEAGSLSDLRAALNSLVRLLDAADRVASRRP